MTSTRDARAVQVTSLREQGQSQIKIARELRISRTRVRQIIDGANASDRMHEDLIARSSTEQLQRHERVLLERIHRDRAWLRATREELESRAVDKAVGLG